MHATPGFNVSSSSARLGAVREGGGGGGHQTHRLNTLEQMLTIKSRLRLCGVGGPHAERPGAAVLAVGGGASCC